MTAESFRAIIIIFGTIWTLGLILFLVMGFYLYRRMNDLQASVTDTVNQIKKVVTENKEAIKPIMQIAAFMDAACRCIDIFNKISGIIRGGKENERKSVD